MSMETGMTPADYAAVSGGNGAWGGEWMMWIVLFFAFGMFGNGWGNNNSGAAQNYVLSSDFSTLQRQIDNAADGLRQQSVQISNGLCDGFYTEAQLVNGVNNNIMQQSNTTNLAMQQGFNNLNVTAMQNANATQRAVENGFANVGYTLATDACAINNAASNNTRDIIEAMNAGFRNIDQRMTMQELEARDAKIAEQKEQIFGYQLAASQQAQNNYLVNTLRPMSVSAYVVQNPYQSYGYGGYYGTAIS